MPGYYQKCGGCRRQLKDGPFPEGYPCKAAYAPNGYALQPHMVIEAGNVVACESYRPNLETTAKALWGKIPILLRAVQSSLPR